MFDNDSKIKEGYVNVYKDENPFGFVYDFPIYSKIGAAYRIHVIPKVHSNDTKI